MQSFTRVTGVTAAALLAVTLSGCTGAFVEVGSKQGIGACGSDAVTLSVTQDSAGSNMTIVYDGPTDSTLVAFQGLYSDTQFFELTPTESYAFNYPIDSSDNPGDIAVNAIDLTDPAWTVTTGASTIHAEYEEEIDQFISDFAYNAATADVNDSIFDRFLPVTIGVVCDSDFTSRVFDAPETTADDVMLALDLAVAQAVFPNFMYVDAPTVTSQTEIENGVHAKLAFPDELGEAFPDDFIPAGMSANTFYLGERDPRLPANDEFPYTLDGVELGDLWFATLYFGMGGDASTSINFTGDLSVTDPVWIDFVGDGAAPNEGYYMVFLLVADDEMVPEHFKMVTAILNYTAEDGLTFETVSERPFKDKLAVTGGDPNVIIWVLVGGLVVLAAVMMRPKRRAVQTKSTIDPSDRNE